MWLWIVLALAAGVMLRVLFHQDMEYKGDERWTFERTQNICRTEPFPWAGAPSSVALSEPPASVWVFLALARLTHATTPVALGLDCMLLNCLALLLLAAFAWFCVPRTEREPWLWAVALAAVNPIHVFLQRKIWPPSVTPFFIMLFVIAWWYRRSRAGALAWGVIGAFIGQIHPAGFFLAGGFAAWTWLRDRAGIKWFYWFVGSVLGSLSLIPWLLHLSHQVAGGVTQHRTIMHTLRSDFFFRWFTQSLGIPDRPFLGTNFSDLIRYPVIAGTPTWLVGIACLVMLLIALEFLIRGARWFFDKVRKSGIPLGNDSTSLSLDATLWGFGILFTITMLPFNFYYMAVTFPLIFVWVPYIALAADGRRTLAPWLGARQMLVVLCLAHFVITLGCLAYVHANRYTDIRTFGVPYSGQMPQ